MVPIIIPIFREFGIESHPDSHLHEVMILTKVSHSESDILPGIYPAHVAPLPLRADFVCSLALAKFNWSALISGKI
jgi:hypothetical protein